MAVTFDSSATAGLLIPAGTATPTVSATHKVSPTAPNLYALVAVWWDGNASFSGGTFSVTFGGQTMTALSGSQTLWATNDGSLELFYLASPPTGSQTVTATVSGISSGSEDGHNRIVLISATYSGVASIGTASAATGASVNLTVPSATAATFVGALSCYAAGAGNSFSAFNQTSHVSMASTANSDPLLIGDAAGTGSVNFTATAPGSNQWAAVGAGLQGISPTFDAAGAGAGGYVTTLSQTHVLGSSATAALCAVEIARDPAPTTVTVTLGGQAMSVLDSVSFSPHRVLYLFGLLNPPTGSQTVTVSTPNKSYITVNSVSYTGVSGFDTAVSNAYSNNTVTAASTTPANRVVSVHGISPIPNVFTYNQTKRAVAPDPYRGAGYQVLLLGDAPGAPSVTSAVTMSTGNANWGAAAVNLTPAPVMLNLSAVIGPVVGSLRLADYRSHTPSPLRTYMVPTTVNEIVTNFGRIGPTWTQAADAVLDYTFDWTNWLASTGDALANCTFTMLDPSVSVISTNVSGSQSTGWLTGGTNGDVYPGICHIVTTNGRQMDQTFNIIVQQT